MTVGRSFLPGLSFATSMMSKCLLPAVYPPQWNRQTRFKKIIKRAGWLLWPEITTRKRPRKTQCFTGSCGSVSDSSHQEINPTRARRHAKNSGKTGSVSESGAKSGAVDIQSGALWADIRALIEACPDLSPAARRKLITLGDRGQL